MQMKHAAAAAVFFSLLVASWAGAAQQDAARPLPQDIGGGPGHLPKVHYIPSRVAESTYPFWVDASMVVNADGSLNTALLHPATTKIIQQFRRISSGSGCVPVGHYFEDTANPPERNTPEEAARNSRLVLLGTVTEREYGFAGDEPGQLLRVTPDEIIKGQARNVGAYYVFVPIGTFRIGSLAICKTDDNYPDPPAIGEQVLLFAPDSWDWQQNQNDPYLELLDQSGIITIHANAKVSLPKRFRDHLQASTSPARAEELLARVRAATAGRETNR
jgi:hypothetical protein